MKILHISSPKSWRGGEQQLAYLIEELRQQEAEQLIMCPVGSEMEMYCKKQGYPYITYHKRFSVNPLVAIKIKRICRQHSIDLIHTHDSHSHTFACLAALLGNKPPIIVSRRVDFPIKNTRLSHWKYNHPNVARILCVSKFIKALITPAINAPEKIEVVYSGVNLSRFPYQASGLLRKAYNIPSDQLIIANVAAIAPHKDYFTFVDTVAVLVKANIPAQFLIIGGDGGEEVAIRAYIKQKKLTKHITFTGFRNDIPKILPEIDILLFTSKTEGLGTTVLDAFTCNVPVVATQAGGIPEMVIHEKTGLMANVKAPNELAQNVIQLINNSTLRNKLVNSAYEKLNEFKKETTALQTLKIYKEILKNEPKTTYPSTD